MATNGSTSPRSRRRPVARALAAFAVAGLTVGLVASCTTTAGKPEAAVLGSTAAGPATAGATGTSGVAGTAGASGPATGPSAGQAPAGATDTSPMIPPITYQTDPDEAALEKVLPGIYGLDSLGATISGSTISINAPATCAFVMEVLGAGQWSITDLVEPTKTSKSYTATLTNGTTRAVLSLSDTGTGCQGMIVAPVTATLSITGALSAHGSAALYPLNCPAGGGTDPIPMYAIYSTPRATYLTAIGVVPAKGTHASNGTDESGDTELLFYRASSTSDLGPALKALAQLTSPPTASGSGDTGGNSDSSLPPGWDVSGLFGSGPATTMSVAVSSVDPLSGTVTATKVVDPAKASSTISLTATFSCGG